MRGKRDAGPAPARRDCVAAKKVGGFNPLKNVLNEKTAFQNGTLVLNGFYLFFEKAL